MLYSPGMEVSTVLNSTRGHWYWCHSTGHTISY